MNKNELIQALYKRTDLPKQEASEVVKIFFDSMLDAFVKGERVEIRGFCSFSIKKYKGYTGRITSNQKLNYKKWRLKKTAV